VAKPCHLRAEARAKLAAVAERPVQKDRGGRITEARDGESQALDLVCRPGYRWCSVRSSSEAEEERGAAKAVASHTPW
jgi:hypothetical protein